MSLAEHRDHIAINGQKTFTGTALADQDLCLIATAPRISLKSFRDRSASALMLSAQRVLLFVGVCHLLQPITVAAQDAQNIELYGPLYEMMPTCDVARTHTPASTAEVAALVKSYYTMQQQGKKVTVRASHPLHHTTTGFACPNGPDSSISVGILHSKLIEVLAVDKTAATMRVGAGMTVKQFQQQATRVKLSVQLGSLPAYAGLTLGGLLATTGHGTGLGVTGAFEDTVIEVTWVDGTGTVHVSGPTDPEFKGFAGGLGSFGIITELLVQMDPGLTLTTVHTYTYSDKNMMRNISNLLKISPHVHIVYHPDFSKFRAFVLTPAKPGTSFSRNTRMYLMPDLTKVPQQSFVNLIEAALNVWTNTTNEDSQFSSFACPQLPFNGQIGMYWAGLGKELPLKGVETATGLTNSMQAADCDPGCVWTTLNTSWHDIEFTIDYSKLNQWLTDIKAIVKTELQGNGQASYRCFGSGYIMMRFGKTSNAYTSTAAGIQRPVFVETIWYRSNKYPNRPMHYQYIADLIEEHTLVAHQGRPHWGKNWDRTMTHPRQPVAALYGAGFQKLLDLQAQYDPSRLFRTSLFDQVAKGDRYKLFDKCSLTQQCYCQADSHCPDDFKCVNSLVFPDRNYKVCKPQNMVDIPGSVIGKLCGEAPQLCSG